MSNHELAAGVRFPILPVNGLDNSLIDISNSPFARPDLENVVAGLEWIRKLDNNYPIRGTFVAQTTGNS